MSQKFYTAEVSYLPKRMAEISGEISTERMAELRGEALKKYVASAEIDGFRKGAAPESMVLAKIGEMPLLEDAAGAAIDEAYPLILEEKEIPAIGRPQISITKIGVGAPLAFKITTALSPEVKLPDYKKIAKGIIEKANTNSIEVTDVEIDEVVLNLRRDVAHARVHKEMEKEGKLHDDHSHAPITDENLPQVDTEFLKELGAFETIEALREKIREGLTNEKKAKAKDKRRTDMLEEIIKASTIDMPDLILNAELDKMIGQFKDDIARSNLSFDDYLKHIGKSEEEIRKEWLPTAEKRAQSQIIVSRISREEEIVPKEEDVKREMDTILSQDKDLDRFRVRMFVDQFLTNELVLRFLETGEKEA